MLRSLIWKEWREQRPIAILGLVVGLGLPLFLMGVLALFGLEERLGDVATLMPVFSWLVLWPLAAVATAATALSGEHSGGRLPFLLSRPVPRPLLLAVKLGIAAAVTVGIVAAGQATALTMRSIAGLDEASAMPIDLSALDPVISSGVISFAALIFVVAAMLGLVMERTLAICGITLAVSALLYGGNFWVWWNLDYAPYPGLGVLWYPAGLALLLTAALFHRFGRAELLRGRQHALRAIGVLAVAIAAWTTAVGSVAAWEMRPPGEDYLVAGIGSTTPDGDAIVTTIARNDHAASRQIAILGANGEVELIGSRLTSQPSISPDGRYVAYLGVAGQLGFRSGYHNVYLWDRQAGTEQAIAGYKYATSWNATPVFSPDSKSVAVQLGGSLIITDVDGGRSGTHAERPPRGVSWCAVAGWDAATGDVIRYCSARGPDAIEWIHPLGGDVRKSMAEDFTQAVRRSSDGAVMAIVVNRTTDNRHWTQHLLLLSGREIPLLEGGALPSFYGGVRATLWLPDRDGRPDRLAYAVNRKLSADPSNRDHRYELRILDLASGVDRILDDADGYHYVDLAAAGSDELMVRTSHVRHSVQSQTPQPHRVTWFSLDDGSRRSRTYETESAYWGVRMEPGRLLYSPTPYGYQGHPADVESTAEQLRMQGFTREIRVLDLETGEDRAWGSKAR